MNRFTTTLGKNRSAAVQWFIRPPWAVSLCLLITGLFTLQRGPSVYGQDIAHQWHFPEIEQFVSIRSGDTLEPISWADFVADLASVEAVFLGETHDDDSTHRFQLAVYDALLSSRNGRVTLAMEMFERDVQSALDDYLQGRIDEPTLLSQTRPWANYHEAYRPLVERAKQSGSPVLASNFPRPLLRRLFQAGGEGLDALGDDRHLAPEELLENPDSYWKRVDNATRGHAAFMPPATDQKSRLLSTQSLWDNSMGETCARALQERPDHQIVHLNGGFHSQYWEGVVHQLRLRRPATKVKTVSIQPSSNPFSAEWIGAPIADYVVFVESRAKNLNEGRWSVLTNQKVDFQFHLPRQASVGNPVPLLIWLPPDGLSASESMDYLEAIWGNESALAVISAPYRQQQIDLSVGGKWFWPDRFPEDIGSSIQAIERVWQYLLDRYPIDPNRVCLAGEYEGATVCCAATLMTSKMTLRSIAVSPRQNAKLKDFPLPLLEDWGDHVPPKRELVVIDVPEKQPWWQQELEEYAQCGLTTDWQDRVDEDPWASDDLLISTIAESLGLQPSMQSGATRERKFVVSEHRTPKELLWLRGLANHKSDPSIHVTVVSAEAAESFDSTKRVQWMPTPEEVSRAIPLSPGSFGGTTVLVLNDQQSAEIERWMSLEKSDPLAARSRFHRLRIATESEGPVSIGKVIEKLLSENRKNLLIVPAEFYANPDRMQKMDRTVAPWIDQMTIHWLPGVGGSIQSNQ